MSRATLQPLSLFRQWNGLFLVYIQDGLAYAASGLIWILSDLVTAFTMPLVWLSAAGGGSIQGFTGPQFVAYYVVMLLISNFVTCHYMWDMNVEIRDGVVSSQLIRPVSWFQFMMVRNFAWRIVRSGLFFPWFLLFVLIYSAQLGQTAYQIAPVFFVSLLLGHVLSFVFVVAVGCLTLFTEEAQSIFELYYFPMLFLSGQMFPIKILPEWAQNLAMLFPFYYTTGLPTEIAVGRVTGSQAWQGIAGQVVWIGLSYVLFHVLWHRGLKRYSGVGM